MRTVGVDLAAEPLRTAVAVLRWEAGGATLDDLVLGADDDALADRIEAADKSGIDAPFGWPLAFVDFVAAHRDGHVVAPADVAGKEWRRRLAFRHTDVATRELTGRWPLSVSADLIAHPAMRCAGLLARLAGAGLDVSRDGTGAVVEVYPAASLRHWALPHRGYKGGPNAARLGEVVDALGAAAPWLVLGKHEALCRHSDDALDAVVAALSARAAALGAVTVPPPDLAATVRREGWIAVPCCALADLTG